MYRGLKPEGIEEAPINICVTCTRERGGPSVLGRASVPETDLYSTYCAIQNLWLSARAEEIGVGWAAILDYADLKEVLGIPQPVWNIAYLCLGYAKALPINPIWRKPGGESDCRLNNLCMMSAGETVGKIVPLVKDY